MNDLIADIEPHQAPSLRENVVSNVPLLGPAEGMFGSMRSGDWSGGLNSMVGGAGDLVGMATDPIGTLASSLASFLLEYVRPFQDFLDELAGNPREVESIGHTWSNISHHLMTLSSDLQRSITDSESVWQGDAGDAYRTSMAARVEDLRSFSRNAADLTSGFIVASGVVEVVRSIVHDICAELVGKLISWAGQIAITAGIGASWVTPQAVSTIKQWISTAQEWCNQLLDAMGRLGEILRAISDFFSDLVPHWDQASRSLMPTGFDVIGAGISGGEQLFGAADRISS